MANGQRITAKEEKRFLELSKRWLIGDKIRKRDALADLDCNHVQWSEIGAMVGNANLFETYDTQFLYLMVLKGQIKATDAKVVDPHGRKLGSLLDRELVSKIRSGMACGKRGQEQVRSDVAWAFRTTAKEVGFTAKVVGGVAVVIGMVILTFLTQSDVPNPFPSKSTKGDKAKSNEEEAQTGKELYLTDKGKEKVAEAKRMLLEKVQQAKGKSDQEVSLQITKFEKYDDLLKSIKDLESKGPLVSSKYAKALKLARKLDVMKELQVEDSMFGRLYNPTSEGTVWFDGIRRKALAALINQNGTLKTFELGAIFNDECGNDPSEDRVEKVRDMLLDFIDKDKGLSKLEDGKKLLKKELVNLEGPGHSRALHHAAKLGNTKRIEKLQEAGAKWVIDSDGKTPLDLAIEHDNGDEIRALLKGCHKAQEQLKDKSKDLLEKVVEEENLGNALGAIITAINEDQSFKDKDKILADAHFHAIQKKNYEMIKELTKMVDVTKLYPRKYEREKSAFECAVETKDIKVVTALVDQLKDIKVLDEKGKTILHYAAENGCEDICQYLMEKDKDKKLVNVKSNYQLQKKGFRGVVGQTFDLEKTPADYARAAGYLELGTKLDPSSSQDQDQKKEKIASCLRIDDEGGEELWGGAKGWSWVKKTLDLEWYDDCGVRSHLLDLTSLDALSLEDKLFKISNWVEDAKKVPELDAGLVQETLYKITELYRDDEILRNMYYALPYGDTTSKKYKHHNKRFMRQNAKKEALYDGLFHYVDYGNPVKLEAAYKKKGLNGKTKDTLGLNEWKKERKRRVKKLRAILYKISKKQGLVDRIMRRGKTYEQLLKEARENGPAVVGALNKMTIDSSPREGIMWDMACSVRSDPNCALSYSWLLKLDKKVLGKLKKCPWFLEKLGNVNVTSLQDKDVELAMKLVLDVKQQEVKVEEGLNSGKRGSRKKSKREILMEETIKKLQGKVSGATLTKWLTGEDDLLYKQSVEMLAGTELSDSELKKFKKEQEEGMSIFGADSIVGERLYQGTEAKKTPHEEVMVESFYSGIHRERPGVAKLMLDEALWREDMGAFRTELLNPNRLVGWKRDILKKMLNKPGDDGKTSHDSQGSVKDASFVLDWAIENGNSALVQELAKNKSVDINKAAEDKKLSYLGKAYWRYLNSGDKKYQEVVKVLLQYSNDINPCVSIAGEKSLLQMVIETKNKDLLAAIIEKKHKKTANLKGITDKDWSEFKEHVDTKVEGSEQLAVLDQERVRTLLLQEEALQDRSNVHDTGDDKGREKTPIMEEQGDMAVKKELQLKAQQEAAIAIIEGMLKAKAAEEEEVKKDAEQASKEADVGSSAEADRQEGSEPSDQVQKKRRLPRLRAAAAQMSNRLATPFRMAGTAKRKFKEAVMARISKVNNRGKSDAGQSSNDR